MKKDTPKKNPVKVVLIVLAVLVFSAFVAAGILFVATYSMGRPVDESKEDAVEITYKVSPGSTFREVAEDLESLGIIRSWEALYLGVRLRQFGEDEGKNLKSGSYSLNSSMTLREIAQTVRKGTPESLSLSIPEGLTVRKVASILSENKICREEDFLSSCRDPNLLEHYNIPADSFEGYLFPDTYFFIPDTPAEDVLSIMADNFFQRIKDIPALAETKPEELHNVVILASIVEREYRVEKEAPVIAGVFKNRLDINMALGSCATIEYILTEIQGKPHPDKITYADLKIENPYNTYINTSLPPGPISNPGMVALKAAAEPEDNKYFYFVLTNPEEGSHTFSETFDQHKAAENLSYYTKK